MDEIKKQTNFEINQVISQPYKYGFKTEIEREIFPVGINENIIRLISEKKKEPQFLLEYRLKAYKKWIQMKTPEWANLDINLINYQVRQLLIDYYSNCEKTYIDGMEKIVTDKI